MLKKIASVLSAVVLASALSMSVAYACPGHGSEAKAEAKKQQEVKKLASAAFKVEGMHCGGCGDKIKAQLGKLEGIVKVDVKVGEGRVLVDYDAAKLSAGKIAETITGVGYKASPEA
ncbi:MAG: heavy-metal-associated domain-containing protein [Deltaproteobacteria bacterium]|nr:heavy-metal-associated domain-containing protein [Deltaproteobacteria bacterium]